MYEEKKEGRKEFHRPDTPNIKTKCKDRSSKGNECLVLIRSGVVIVITHHHTPFTRSVFSGGQVLLASSSEV